MPSRNVIKLNADQAYYHVYGRGQNKDLIYLDMDDYQYFLQLFARHLSNEMQLSKDRRAYLHLQGRVDILCYCLMPNHFHLLVYQKEMHYMAKLMQAILLSYTAYFNQKYQRTGPLLESRYKASYVTNDSHLEHLGQYIHQNPDIWENYPYSSLQYYRSGQMPEWLNVLGLYTPAKSSIAQQLH